MLRPATRRLFTVTALATILSGGLVTVTSPASAAAATGTVKVSGGALKLRTGPTTSARVIGALRNNARVKIACYVKGQRIRGTVRTTTTWDRLTNGRYVSHAYVRGAGPLRRCAAKRAAAPARPVSKPVVQQPAKKAPAAAVAGTVKSNDGTVNLRQGPSTGTSVVGQLANGARLTIACAVRGDQISGTVRTTNQWDRLRDGRYISHAYVAAGAVPVCSGSAAPTTVVPKTNAQFIAMAVPGAQRGWRDYGVPPSVTIAQAILESGWGRSGLAANDRNFFGIKCFDGNPGSIAAGCRTYKTTECTKQGRCFSTSDTFRTYRAVADSFRDHGHFLRVNRRYKPAFAHTRDANKFLMAVWQAGYATDPNYYAKVTGIMRTYDLYRYDTWR